MKLYKDSYNKFWIENETSPSGVYSISFSEDNLICIIRSISTQAIRYNGLVTGLLKENGVAYTNRTDLETLVSDFFVNALAAGGGVDSISKRVITHSDGGTINVETFVGKVEVSLGYGYGYGYEESIMIGEW